MLNVRTGLYLASVVVVSAIAFVGCSKQSEPQPTQGAASSDDWKTGLTPEVIEAFSQLSEADRVAALKQKVCPVADNPLGSMGAPYKVTVNGQGVFLCCEACEEEITSNPDKYLAKLNKSQ